MDICSYNTKRLKERARDRSTCRLGRVSIIRPVLLGLAVATDLERATWAVGPVDISLKARATYTRTCYSRRRALYFLLFPFLFPERSGPLVDLAVSQDASRIIQLAIDVQKYFCPKL